MIDECATNPLLTSHRGENEITRVSDSLQTLEISTVPRTARPTGLFRCARRYFLSPGNGSFQVMHPRHIQQRYGMPDRNFGSRNFADVYQRMYITPKWEELQVLEGMNSQEPNIHQAGQSKKQS